MVLLLRSCETMSSAKCSSMAGKKQSIFSLMIILMLGYCKFVAKIRIIF